MVFFTCNACGQSLKKNHVEKHCTTQCRNCESLSCMDCGKDFWGEEYKMHVKCISEEEKYSGKDFKAKANKGEEKQESWTQLIQNTINTATDLTPDLRGFLEQLVTYSNVPRKQAKFENYVRNSMRVKNENLIARAWEVFNSAHKSSSEKKSESIPTSPVKVDAESPAVEDEDKKEKKKKKKKSKGGNDENEPEIAVVESKEISDANDSTLKKKHKKRKHSGLEDEPSAENAAVEATTPVEEGEGKKKKKKKKSSGIDSEAMENGENVAEISLNVEVTEQNGEATQVDAEDGKSKKRKKRKSCGEGELIENTEVASENASAKFVKEESIEAEAEGKRSKKRKKENLEQKLNGINGEEENRKHKKTNNSIIEQNVDGDHVTNGELVDSSKKRKKGKKHSKEGIEETEQGANSEEILAENNGPSQPTGKFKWAKVAETLLLQTPEKTLQVKKLKKKIFAEYFSQNSEVSEDVKEQMEEKFASKVTNNERFLKEGKLIKLVA